MKFVRETSNFATFLKFLRAKEFKKILKIPCHYIKIISYLERSSFAYNFQTVYLVSK